MRKMDIRSSRGWIKVHSTALLMKRMLVPGDQDDIVYAQLLLQILE